MVPPESVSRRAGRFLLVLIVALLVPCAACADDRTPTLERLEFEHLMNQAMQAFEKQVLPIEELSADFRYRCLRAIGAAGFCECLVEHRPYSLRFEHYVRITSRTRVELGYERLSADARRLIDKVYEVRDACVAPEPRAPGEG